MREETMIIINMKIKKKKKKNYMETKIREIQKCQSRKAEVTNDEYMYNTTEKMRTSARTSKNVCARLVHVWTYTIEYVGKRTSVGDSLGPLERIDE